MIILLSPAKKIDESPVSAEMESLTPFFADEIKELVSVMQQHDKADVKKLMGVSDAIAELNVRRYQEFEGDFTIENAKPAIYSFAGDVYSKINVEDYTPEQLAFMNKHVRILSGLYGVLAPLDLMQPYRLEMGTRLENSQGKNLYAFWGDKITRYLNDALAKMQSDVVINLASTEYFKAVKPAKLNAKLITLHFKEKRDGKYKVISFNAKRARGMMTDYLVTHNITDVEAIKSFNQDGYEYYPPLSDAANLVFVKS